ncbi:MAG: type II-A CRISPR-associated protein Csn2 [Bacillales bacterium]|jgi:CRISPR type II-A-associated protein Csn2|nr:type II-A CRISPR-associated protein Csn2 [Bacillales bacterium]
MIFFKFKSWENKIIFDGSHYIISIEEKQLFSDYLIRLSQQYNGEDNEDYILQKDFKDLSIETDLEIISDLSSFQINSRKLITLLFKKITNATKNSDLPMKVEEINALMAPIIKEIASLIDLPLQSNNDLELDDFLKLYGVKLEEKYETLIEKIIHYIDSLFELKKINCIVLYLAYEYLTDSEINELYKHCEYLEITTIIFEGKYDKRNSSEKVLIIDKDNCEIRIAF